MLLVEPLEVFLDHNCAVQCELVAAAMSSFPLLQGLILGFLDAGDVAAFGRFAF